MSDGIGVTAGGAELGAVEPDADIVPAESARLPQLEPVCFMHVNVGTVLLNTNPRPYPSPPPAISTPLMVELMTCVKS